MKDKERERVVLQLKSRGVTIAQIAEHLSCDEKTVRRLYARAFDEYLADHTKLVQQKLAENLAGCDALLRIWTPKALGGLTKKTIDGKEREVEIEPSIKAAEMVLRTRAVISRMMGHGQTLRHELTGAGGGPIETANVGPQEAARAVREMFGNKAARPMPTLVPSPKDGSNG